MQVWPPGQRPLHACMKNTGEGLTSRTEDMTWVHKRPQHVQPCYSVTDPSPELQFKGLPRAEPGTFARMRHGQQQLLL